MISSLVLNAIPSSCEFHRHSATLNDTEHKDETIKYDYMSHAFARSNILHNSISYQPYQSKFIYIYFSLQVIFVFDGNFRSTIAKETVSLSSLFRRLRLHCANSICLAFLLTGGTEGRSFEDDVARSPWSVVPERAQSIKGTVEGLFKRRRIASAMLRVGWVWGVVGIGEIKPTRNFRCIQISLGSTA